MEEVADFQCILKLKATISSQEEKKNTAHLHEVHNIDGLGITTDWI